MVWIARLRLSAEVVYFYSVRRVVFWAQGFGSVLGPDPGLSLGLVSRLGLHLVPGPLTIGKSEVSTVFPVSQSLTELTEWAGAKVGLESAGRAACAGGKK